MKTLIACMCTLLPASAQVFGTDDFTLPPFLSSRTNIDQSC